MSDSSGEKQRSSSSLSNQSEEKNINGKRKHSNTQDETSTNGAGRKKYNVINEDVRKKIIKKLTEENANIKEVAQEYGLKLSTCKAILQVYQKEGRIGKKATRDRKSKIVSTILVTRIDPMNPSISTITPYIHITEAKTASKKGDDDSQSELVKEAFKNAQDHVKSVIQQNSQEIYFGKVPSSCKRDLESSFLEAQRDAIKNLLKNNPLPMVEIGKSYSSPEPGKQQGLGTPMFSPYSHVNNANQMNQIGLINQQPTSGKSIEGPTSNIIISQNGKQSFKQCNFINQTDQIANNGLDSSNPQLGLQQFDTTSLSNNMQDNEQALGIQESQKKIKSGSKIGQSKSQKQLNAQFAQPGIPQLQQSTSQNGIQGFGSFSNQNVASSGYPGADANLMLDQYNQNLKNNNAWNEGSHFNNQSQYTFNNFQTPNPSLSTMNASPAITPFLNPFTLNSPQFSSAQNNQYTSFLSPLNLALNSNSAPAGHKPSQFSLNSNYGKQQQYNNVY